ncbi:unnamed protein product [Rotaria sordida]|uniref:CCHC-type domain-containing protein n=1 Tax=Rotaria sordida TaxID=392033 RepID=A0A814Z0J8_9BILA|nr:unnamed protein product [Rotaria sordida]CAF1388193.1 unnamed protein product [Rotaria sordida]CAF3964866.1 unnamed protein product [Rotaria sordida]
MNLKMLRDRKQGDTESFTEYYASVVDLCHKNDPNMADLQIIDWLKADIKLKLYERVQGEEFATAQALLIRAQRLELDNAVLEARKRDSTMPIPAASSTSSPSFNRSSHWDQPLYRQPQSTSNYTSSYSPPLMSILHSPYPFQSSPYPYASSPVTHTSTRPRRSIVCYSCGQPGHISPYCPARPKD